MKGIQTSTEQRVMLYPISEFTISFHQAEHDEIQPIIYVGRREEYTGGINISATPEGFLEDGFARDNYMAWVEERTVYTIDPEPWEVI